MKTFILILGAAFIGLYATASAQTTREEQQALTPDLVVAQLKAGNDQYVRGETTVPNSIRRRQNSVGYQFPKAVILSCIDSRVPVELVFNQGIGDIFVGRVAGNIEDVDLLGSMEYATKFAGAKLVVVLGHTGCGAIRSAINGQTGVDNLDALLAKIRPAVDAVTGFKPEERVSSNPRFVDAVIEKNVQITLANIRKHSSILAAWEGSGKIRLVGAVCDLETGKVRFLP